MATQRWEWSGSSMTKMTSPKTTPLTTKTLGRESLESMTERAACQSVHDGLSMLCGKKEENTKQQTVNDPWFGIVIENDVDLCQLAVSQV